MTETNFAPAKRRSNPELKIQVEHISNNPVITGLLSAANGLLAVLNEERQILAMNGNLLTMMGITDPEAALGLRPGEALACVHADELAGGCGTSSFCSSCGAAIAIVTSLIENHPVQKTCALKAVRDGREIDIYFVVHAHPVMYNGERLLLLFLQDITQEQKWATLERIFFHDTTNTLTGLISASELLYKRAPEMEKKLAENVNHLAIRLSKDFKIQQILTRSDVGDYQLLPQEVTSQTIFTQLEHMFSNHPIKIGKKLTFSSKVPQQAFFTDQYVLIRILANMITNALEASDQGQEVKVWSESKDGNLLFVVWNQQYIPPEIEKRIFQRNFSTKAEMGRGIGTYAMKLFGEEVLGGTVDFHTSKKVGTTFFLKLPT